MYDIVADIAMGGNMACKIWLAYMTFYSTYIEGQQLYRKTLEKRTSLEKSHVVRGGTRSDT